MADLGRDTTSGKRPFASSAATIEEVASSAKSEQVEQVESPSSLIVRSSKCRVGLLLQIYATVIITISFLVSGTSLAWSSPVFYNMQKTGDPMNLTHSEESLMVALYYIGNIVMPIPGGMLSDLIGRKRSLLILCILPISSWVLTYYASIPWHLHSARFLGGMWTGTVLAVAPLYVAEIVEAHVRGRLMGTIAIMVNVGVLLSYTLGPRLSYGVFSLVLLAFPISFFLLMTMIPESPYWYARKGSNSAAAQSLAWYRGVRFSGARKDEVEEELKVIMQGIDPDTKTNVIRAIIHSKGNRRAFMIVEVLSILQRFTGVSCVVAYGAVTLPERDIGVIKFSDSMVVIAVFWFLIVMVNPFLVDHLGRKPLLVISSIGTGISTLLLAIWYYYHRSSSPEDYVLSWAPFALFMTYGLFINSGLGPLVPTLQGEMFPPHLKGFASGVSSMLTAVGSALTTGFYFPIADSAGTYVNYIIYTLMCFIAAVFSWTYVLETRGKSLYQIQVHLDKYYNKGLT